MSDRWRDEYTDRLCDCIAAISDREEAYRFLEDAATFAEIKALAQRLQVASLLLKGLSYPQIVEATGASSATISRVKKCVQYGSEGYRDVLTKIGVFGEEKRSPKEAEDEQSAPSRGKIKSK